MVKTISTVNLECWCIMKQYQLHAHVHVNTTTHIQNFNLPITYFSRWKDVVWFFWLCQLGFASLSGIRKARSEIWPDCEIELHPHKFILRYAKISRKSVYGFCKQNLGKRHHEILLKIPSSRGWPTAYRTFDISPGRNSYPEQVLFLLQWRILVSSNEIPTC